MKPYTFTAGQVVDLTGMSKPVLSDLIRRGILAPTRHRGAGTGDNHLFDTADLLGIASVQRLRPKGETTSLLRTLFEFWHSDEGLRLVDGPRPIAGVVVIDGKGVSFLAETDVVRLSALVKSAAFYVIEPNSLAEDLFGDVAHFRMTHEHMEPLPSGREPRLRPAATKKPRKGGDTKPGKNKKKLPALLRESRAKLETKKPGKKNGGNN